MNPVNMKDNKNKTGGFCVEYFEKNCEKCRLIKNSKQL